MNANELADELKEISLIADNHTKIVLGIAQTMLRQQQAEIEELKAKLQLHEAMDNQCASLMRQFREVQEK